MDLRWGSKPNGPEGRCTRQFYYIILIGYKNLGECKFYLGFNSSPEICNEEGIKDVTGIILTL